ncbi:MAG: T9SS type A sorting domain-containing protein [Muribaculaceae bacterium]|nr:T9SS type A sorting domain-containing protein [Muribaculaceae bacterium]
MKRLLMILSLTMLLAGWNQADGQLQWRDTNQKAMGRMLIDPSQTDGVEIYSNSSTGTITIKTPHKIQVRVFTILGQLVSQATLNPGTSELKINSRGVYIVKIGNITQKVAL